MLARRHAVAVGQIDVCSRTDQKPDDLDVLRAAVTQDDGLEQGGSAEIVDVIDVDAGRNECAHGLHMTALGRRNERGAAVTVRAL